MSGEGRENPAILFAIHALKVVGEQIAMALAAQSGSGPFRFAEVIRLA